MRANSDILLKRVYEMTCIIADGWPSRYPTTKPLHKRDSIWLGCQWRLLSSIYGS